MSNFRPSMSSGLLIYLNDIRIKMSTTANNIYEIRDALLKSLHVYMYILLKNLCMHVHVVRFLLFLLFVVMHHFTFVLFFVLGV